MQITNTKQFIELFNFTEESGFYDPIHLQDEEVGFSIKKRYPKNIRFKPACKRNGEPDEVIVIWLVFNLPKTTRRESTNNNYPIFLKINKYSIYKTKYFDYDFDNENSPTKKSLDISKTTVQPLELEYVNEFSFDASNNCFFDNKGISYSGIQMLDYVVKEHLNTVHLVKGFKIRSKRFTQMKIGEIFRLLIKTLVYILRNFGRSLQDSDSELLVYHGFKSEDMKRITTDTIEIFKYQASKQVIFIFCFIVIIISSIDYFFNLNSSYLKYITSNNLVISIYAISLLIILDRFVPLLLFHSINALVRIRNKIIFRKLKV